VGSVLTLELKSIIQPMNSENTLPPISTQTSVSKHSNGFTLVEVLIVMALIGLLATLAVVNVGKTLESAKINTARTFISSSLKAPIANFHLDVGTYPKSLNDLKTNPGKGNRWRGPYVDKKLEDPWGNEYQYRTPSQRNTGAGYDLWSNGPDGQSGSADDIGNWDS
jgi:general secretion pathway protein G